MCLNATGACAFRAENNIFNQHFMNSLPGNPVESPLNILKLWLHKTSFGLNLAYFCEKEEQQKEEELLLTSRTSRMRIFFSLLGKIVH